MRAAEGSCPRSLICRRIVAAPGLVRARKRHPHSALRGHKPATLPGSERGVRPQGRDAPNARRAGRTEAGALVLGAPKCLSRGRSAVYNWRLTKRLLRQVVRTIAQWL